MSRIYGYKFPMLLMLMLDFGFVRATISSIPYVQYTCTNTRFSYTFIYEHTHKILLTDIDKYIKIHNIRTENRGLDCL